MNRLYSISMEYNVPFGSGSAPNYNSGLFITKPSGVSSLGIKIKNIFVGPENEPIDQLIGLQLERFATLSNQQSPLLPVPLFPNDSPAKALCYNNLSEGVTISFARYYIVEANLRTTRMLRFPKNYEFMSLSTDNNDVACIGIFLFALSSPITCRLQVIWEET